VPEVLDLGAVVTDLVKMLRRLIGEDVALMTVLHAQAGKVKADRGQLEQVIMNLVVNARDAMPRGGKLIIEVQSTELDESYARTHPGVASGPHVMLAVTDTGIGMDEETRRRVFEPFFTTKEKGKGTGLGLATVYGIVRQSGGSIWVYSEPGKGTTFKLYLPRVEDAMEAPPHIEGLPEGGSETILLVEDEDMVRRMARDILETSGYRVLEAANGEEALRIVRGHEGPIHLLLTDVVMPGMGGREGAERLARSQPGMKVLYMSGYTDDAIVHQGVLAQGIAFIQKPLTPRALTRKIREVLDLR
jgi:CheY-like chemotaxis protein